MVTGRTYQEIWTELVSGGYFRLDTFNGITSTVQDEILARHGFAVIRLTRFDPITNQRRTCWPPAPFASIHIAQVLATQGAHAVVVDPTGQVLDPWDQNRTSLAHPDYREVSYLAGLYQVHTLDLANRP